MKTVIKCNKIKSILSVYYKNQVYPYSDKSNFDQQKINKAFPKSDGKSNLDSN